MYQKGWIIKGKDETIRSSLVLWTSANSCTVSVIQYIHVMVCV